jgi:hypothetical protein
MPTGQPRYAQTPRFQADLAQWHARFGGDHTGCYQRTCSVCAKVFYATMPHASLCSERCNQNAVLARRREARRAEHSKTCPRCHRTFVARRKDGVYCSNACRQASHRVRGASRLASLQENEDTGAVTGAA